MYSAHQKIRTWQRAKNFYRWSKLRFSQVKLFPQGQMLNEKQNSIGTLPSPARPLHPLLWLSVKTSWDRQSQADVELSPHSTCPSFMMKLDTMSRWKTWVSNVVTEYKSMALRKVVENWNLTAPNKICLWFKIQTVQERATIALLW